MSFVASLKSRRAGASGRGLEQLGRQQGDPVCLGHGDIIIRHPVTGEDFGQGRRVALRVLAEVEGGQVEAEHLDLADQPGQPAVRQAGAAVRPQALLDQAQVGDELFDALVGGRAGQVVGAPGPARRLERGPELAVDVIHLVAVGLHRVARGQALGIFREEAGVGRDAGGQFVRDAIAHRHAEVAVHPVDGPLVKAQHAGLVLAQAPPR